jgi:aminoglycoside 6'-N-acetyltransferase I
MITVRLLGPNDAAVLDQVAPGVFDHPTDPRWTAEFFADPRHHLAVALDGTTVVGMASAVHYVHPDKAPALWVNEVGVAPAYQRRGLGTQLLRAIVERGRTLGCTEAWLGTETSNEAARALYNHAGWREEAEPFVTYTIEIERK